MKKNILLIAVDSKYPNLALMKISAWHKKLGDIVYLNSGCSPDIVYISCIFQKNKPQAFGIAKMFPQAHVQFGGYAINNDVLPPEIEHLMPDYGLYGMDHSIGFTARGCNRRCQWCRVPVTEGGFRENSQIEEFLHPEHKKVVIMDNNFLQSGLWKKKFRFLQERDLKVNFNQGLDIRLVTKNVAREISRTKISNHNWTGDYVHFAWDDPNICSESVVRRGIGNLLDSGVKADSIIFYILTGFNTTFQDDFHRFSVLRELGIQSFAMIYNDRRDLPDLRHFARWINRRFYKVCDFKDILPLRGRHVSGW